MEKYIVNKEIGAGSFGKVFIVKAKTTGIQYVVKQIDLSKLTKKQRSLAEKEIQVLSRLKHPNIVRYKEAYSDDQHLHIFMEYCERGDLHEKIKSVQRERRYFTDVQVMEYFVQICLAVEYIHQLRIIHRDIKTKNVFVTKGYVIKLGDFGVAKILENSFELAETCIGSPFYVSPEICENRPYDKKCDVWSLGCVLYELTTLRYAFTASNMKTLLTKITTADHNPVPDNTNREIRILIELLLRPNPKQRPSVSDILGKPFVKQFKSNFDGKICRRVASIAERSKSIEDLRKKTADLKFTRLKSSRPILQISKSSLNLNSSDLTNPEMKYKGKSRLPKPIISEKAKFFNKHMNNFDPDYLNIEPNKVKKLPKSDSHYLKLIEKNVRREPKAVNVIRNILDINSEEEETYCGETLAERRKTFDKKESAECTAKENQEKEDCAHVELKSRKKWNVNTADRRQLINLLSEAELLDDRALNDINIDDLLSMGTTDMSHVPVLLPQASNSWTADCQSNNGDLISFPMEKELSIDEATFIVDDKNEDRVMKNWQL